MEDDQDWFEYESGPFCRHYGDPLDCDVLCANCEHRCNVHAATEGDLYCNEENCDCNEWIEPP